MTREPPLPGWMMQAEIDHIREIETLSRGGPSTRDPVVQASWQRCIDKHGLDPTTRSEAYILPDSALRQHRQQSQELIAIARSGIDNLYRLVAGQDYVLLLSDAAGVTVEYLGEDNHKAELRRSGLYLGAEWSEARAGTCALGACIETGEPLIIHQSDHFDVTHGGLSCTAAPIYDTSGRLAAVLDISLLSSPLPRASQFLALNLVRQAARRIEMANLMAENRQDWVLRLAASPEFLDVDPEAALTLDGGGHVIGMTNGAARLMARALGQDWRMGAGLIGRHVSDILDLRLETLEGLTRQRAARDRLIQTRDGYRLFAHAIEPRRLPAPKAPRASQLPADLRALAGDDPTMTQVIERAARLASGPQPILLCGPSGSGKTTLARTIHSVGRRGPLVSLDCGTISEEEAPLLFGREDRRGHEAGLIEAAEGGTLLLERVDELPPRLQARLMPVLTDRRWRPVGALRERPTTARLILTLTAEDPALRADLLHRLAGARLALPALTHRRDLLALAERVLARAFDAPLRIEAEAAALLTAQGFPGNLHDLTALAQRLAEAAAPRRAGDRLILTARDLAPHLPPPPSKNANPAALLQGMLEGNGWNISATARALGLDRSTVHRQMQRLGLNRRR